MATVRNYIDTLLQAASPRINSIVLPTNVKVDTTNVSTGLQANIDSKRNVIFRQATDPGIAATDYDMWQDTSVTPNIFKTKISGVWVNSGTVNTGLFANLSGQVTPSNYATYLADNTVSILGFSQNQTVHSTTLNTSLNVNSDNKNVVVIISGRLACDWSDPIPGYSVMNALLTVGGVTKYNDQLARFVNSTTSGYNQVSASIPVQVNSPGSGSITYSLTITRSYTGSGSGGSVAWPTIQVIGLKV